MSSKVLFIISIILGIIGGAIIAYALGYNFWKSSLDFHLRIASIFLSLSAILTLISFVWTSIQVYNNHQFVWWWYANLLLLIIYVILLFLKFK